MSTNYGIQCVSSSGAYITSNSPYAALFAGKVVCSITSGTQTVDFTSVPYGSMFGVQYGAGTHTWAFSNVSGYTRLTFTIADYTNQSAKPTTLLLYCNSTFEPNYGVNAVNDAGQRLISTILPNSRFVGKAVVAGQTAYTYSTATGVNSWGIQSAAMSYIQTSANHSTLVFWSIPSDTGGNNVYWMGQPALVSNKAVMNYDISIGGVQPTVWPEAFVFEVGPYVAPSSTYGIRVYNASGQVMYDGGTPQLVIMGYLESITFGSTAASYTIPSGMTTPAFVFPQWRHYGKYGGYSGGYADARDDWGGFRRVGTTLYAKRGMMDRDTDAIPSTWTITDWYYGNSTNLFVPFLDAASYGGSTI